MGSWMKFTPLVYKLECMVYVTVSLCIHNRTKFQQGSLPETHEDGAMKSCSVRESKIIAHAVSSTL